MEIRRITRLAMMITLAIVLSLVESMIPLFNGIVPGLKLGFANVAIMVTLYVFGVKEAFFVSLARILIVGLLRTGLFNITFFFSLSGALFSLSAMALLKKSPFSILGVSVVGAVMHTLGQLFAAFVFLNNANIFYYLPILTIFSIFTGVLIGYISKQMITNFAKIVDRNTKM